MADASATPQPAAAIRRTRFGAKPNLLEVGRRLTPATTPATTPTASPKSAPSVGGSSDVEIKGPPPVRRVTKRVFTPLVIPQTANSETRAASVKAKPAKPLSEAIVVLPPAPQTAATPPTPVESTPTSTPLPDTVETAGTTDPPSEGSPQLIPAEAMAESSSTPSEMGIPAPVIQSRINPMAPPLAPSPVVSPAKSTTAVSPAKSMAAMSEASGSTQSPVVSPVKQRKRKLSSRGEELLAEAKAKRRKYKKGAEPPEKTKMTMFDLIHWNPSNNPMTYAADEDYIVAPLAKPADKTNEERLAEEREDDPGNMSANGDGEDCMPMPQVKIGADGKIILDERSLFIQTTKTTTDLSSSPAVYENSSHTTYASFRKKKPIKFWTERETARFYVALSTVGTDFSMMLKLFPTRTRHELKTKFKKEDRANKCLVDRAINDHQQYNLSIFEDNDELETEDEEKALKKAKADCKSRAKRAPKKPKEPKEPKEKKTRKPRTKRRATFQEVSDSESEGDLVIDESSPTKSHKSNSAEETVDQRGASSNHDPETDDTNADERISDPEESDEVDSVLKPTRSGRQPKKKPVFTISIATPKRRCPPGGRPTNPHTLSESDESPSSPATIQLDPGLMDDAQQLVFFAENPTGGGTTQKVHMFMMSPRGSDAVGRSPMAGGSLFAGTAGMMTPTRLTVPEAITSPPTPDHGYALTALIPAPMVCPAVESANLPGYSGNSETDIEATSLS